MSHENFILNSCLSIRVSNGYVKSEVITVSLKDFQKSYIRLDGNPMLTDGKQFAFNQDWVSFQSQTSVHLL